LEIKEVKLDASSQKRIPSTGEISFVTSEPKSSMFKADKTSFIDLCLGWNTDAKDWLLLAFGFIPWEVTWPNKGDGWRGST